MSDDQLWKKRFQLFLAIRLFGLAMFLLGIAIAFSDLVQPGGWKLLGGLLAVMGAIDAVVAPRILKRSWERQDR
jgi:membrane protein implicated in regulation of membrane protease activity